MNCPKCGAQNPDDAQICGSCNAHLTEADEHHPRVKVKTSRLAILSLVLGILSLLFFILAGIPAIVVGSISLLKIKRSGGALKGKYIALAGMNISIIFMCIFYWLWSRDAPPIPNDYTLADLRSAPTEDAESFEILKNLIDEEWGTPGAPIIGLSDGDIDMIDDIRNILEEGDAAEISRILRHHTKDIETAWSGSEKARDTIRGLNKFPDIADLTKPSVDFNPMRWQNLMKLARLYQVYAHLQTRPNDIHMFTVDLIMLDSVFRKLFLNVRLFVHRLICYICLETDLETANAIVNNPNTLSSTVELLAKQFKPLTNEQLSIRNGVLFGYLGRVAVLNDLKADRAVKTHHLKINSTLRVYKNLYDNWLIAVEQNAHVTTRLSAWPDHYPFKDPDPLSMEWSLPMIYRFYNPVGSRLICMDRRSIDIGFKKRFTLPFSDDLFQIVLNKRLGKEVSLKARAYGDEYIVDVENKKIFSPGSDGIAGTKDDITLRINPEVLGWGN